MKQLKQSILALIALIGLLFVVERLRSVPAAGFVDLAIVQFLLAFAAAALMLGWPVMRRQPTVALWAIGSAVYVACAVAIAGDFRYLNSSGAIATSLVELIGLGGVIWLAQDIALRSDHLEDIVINRTLAGKGKPVKLLDEAADEVRVEVLRGLRYHRPLSVIVVEPAAESLKAALPAAVQQAQRELAGRYVLSKLGRAISDVIRHTDAVYEECSGDRFVVVCPETDSNSARALMQRIQFTAANGLGISVACGEASLKEAKVTFEELMREAEHGLAFPEPPAS